MSVYPSNASQISSLQPAAFTNVRKQLRKKMAFRGTESPMDFEWHGHGPVDSASPFVGFAMDPNKKRKVGPHKWIPSSEYGAGSHAQFNSPNKHQLPSFGPPNGRPFYFSDVPPSPAPPASAFRAPSFTTPRKPFDMDFSSGAENSSPLNGDNEETPDAASPIQFTANSASPSKSTKRNSLFGMYNKFAPSPSRITRPFHEALERRIHKRRRRALDKNQLVRARRDSEETSESEADTTIAISKSRRSPSKPLPFLPQDQNRSWRISDFFEFISSKPDLPSILSRYLQVLFNFALLSFFLFVIYSFYQAIRADVDRASDEAASITLAEMSTCSKQYIENNCAPDKRLPALEQLCSNWELCMNQRPEAVKRASLSARTFAEIFNSFIEPLSLKTVAVSMLIVVAAIFFGNAPFVMFRRQYESHHHPMAYPPGWSQHNSGVYANMQQMGHTASTPGLSYGHEPQTPATGRHWQAADQPTFDNNHMRIEWNRSPSKDHGNRGRSRSPEKRAL